MTGTLPPVASGRSGAAVLRPYRMNRRGWQTAADNRVPEGAVAENTVRVHFLVRAALYAYVMSIPFEWPDRTIPVEIPTLMGAIFLLATVVQPTACFRRIPMAGLLFAAHLCLFGLAAIVNGVDHPELTMQLFIWLVQVVLLFWVTFNLLADERVVRGVLVALIAACVVRAGMQLLGIATTTSDVWTGGQRITVLGQNANLSAMILSAGLAAAIGLRGRTRPPLRRLGVLVWPVAILIGIAIIQTGSRGGLLCAGVGISMFLVTGGTLARRVRNGLLCAVGVGLLGWGAYRSEVMRGRFEAAEGGQLAGRERIYPALLAMVSERPVLGWGPIDNQFEIAKRIDERARQRRDAHNLVLEVLTTTGIVGAVPFLLGLGLCVRGAWRARRGPLGVLPLAMVAAVLMGTVTGTWVVGKIVWLALAFGLAAGYHWTPASSGQRVRWVKLCAV